MHSRLTLPSIVLYDCMMTSQAALAPEDKMGWTPASSIQPVSVLPDRRPESSPDILIADGKVTQTLVNFKL